MYGRVGHSRCQTQFVSNNIDKCVTPVDSALRFVKYYCDKKNRCQIRADTNSFGDPCVNYSKYLDVKYNCLDESQFP